MIPVLFGRRSIAAAVLSLGILAAVASPARAQDMPPGKAAPQAALAVPQTTYAAPQAGATGPYASIQSNRPCACYFPQGYCPFPRGNCAFPRGNCVAIRPSMQQPLGSSQVE